MKKIGKPNNANESRSHGKTRFKTGVSILNILILTTIFETEL